MDVSILAPVQDNPLPPVTWNFEEVRAWISQSLESYKGRVYRPEELKNAKADRATLNKLLTALEDRRKEIKKMYLDPYAKFEAQIKECTSLIQQCTGTIAEQINAMEDAERREKLGKIEDTFDAFCPAELAQLVELDKLLDPRWLNKTVSMDAIEDALKSKFGQIKAGIAALQGIASESDRPAVIDRFLKDYDLGAALAYGQHLQKQRETLATKAAAVQLQSVAAMDIDHAPPPEPEPTAEDESFVTVDFRVVCNRQQLDGLKAYLKTNNIKYGRVPQN